MPKPKPNFTIRIEMQDGMFAAICGGFVALGATAMEAVEGLESTGTVTRMGWEIELRSNRDEYQQTQKSDIID